MARFVDLHPENPQARMVRQVVEAIKDEDALIAYPTDSGYALGCRLGNRDGRDRILKIRGLDDRHHFTLLCADFGQLGQLVHVDNAAFRAIRACTPGPYTFILPGTPEVPRRLLHPKKKTVGVRIPDHVATQAILAELGEPLLSSTLILPGEEEPRTIGWDVKEELDHVVDIVIEAGETPAVPTTVVDWSEGYPEVTRLGAGDASRFE
ncbi:L-threonylcarbamoyladenylate synthase [Nocardioides sp. GY 10127]|uniref:L-threonylcarbamoyladenylate synthase n=1 Tax=Nocardioides sp. GY 10127 TaxID=2569762 RepID=UPI0010A83ADF|nr:L-threonylcarbamoyladenylate synthase [Nocardioides sp. GY 10127]TIC81721.1 threonylcarbamoyl-AMP synthase [Nocardioides sp. GY 10127]